MDQPLRIGIVGPGKVGSAWALLAEGAKMRVQTICARTEAAARQAARKLRQDPPPRLTPDALADCQVVLLCVRDDQIEPTCRQLADDGHLAPGSILAHCSGSLGSDALAPAAEIGLSTASIHPLQTFPDVESAARRLPGSFVFCEGDSAALLTLEPMLRQMGTIAVRIDPAGKALYHAAAVMACNYLTGLFDAALALAGQAGIHRDTAARALGPLVQATVANVLADGPVRALTGPVARGDAGTIRRHLQALQDRDEDLLDLYRAAGLWTLRVARSKAAAETVQLDEVESLLRNYQDPQHGC